MLRSILLFYTNLYSSRLVKDKMLYCVSVRTSPEELLHRHHSLLTLCWVWDEHDEVQPVQRQLKQPACLRPGCHLDLTVSVQPAVPELL